MFNKTMKKLIALKNYKVSVYLLMIYTFLNTNHMNTVFSKVKTLSTI